MLRLGFLVGIIVLGVAPSAWAQGDVAIAGVSFNDADARVLDRLDEMLDAPTRRSPGGAARSRDAIVAVASSRPERYVVVVDLSGRRVYAFEPRAQRSVEREIASDLVHEPYSVAGILYELLDLLGAVAPEPEDPGPGESEPRELAHQGVRFDGVSFALGGRAAIGLTDEPRWMQLVGAVDVTLALTSRLRLLLGASGAGFGREHASSAQGSMLASLTYRRTELGLRAGLGRSFTPRFALYGLALVGVGFGRIEVQITNPGMNPGHDADRWRNASLGLGLEGRITLGHGLALAPFASLDTLVRAHDYSGRAGSEFHESPIRITFGLALAWGTSTGGAERAVQQNARLR